MSGGAIEIDRRGAAAPGLRGFVTMLEWIAHGMASVDCRQLYVGGITAFFVWEQ